MKLFRELKVRLSDEEWTAAAMAMSAEQAKINEVEAQKAEVMTKFKSQLQSHSQRLIEYCHKVQTHEELRAVECQQRFDLVKFVAEVHRLDTGELVESRPMTSQERQDALQETLPHMDGN